MQFNELRLDNIYSTVWFQVCAMIYTENRRYVLLIKKCTTILELRTVFNICCQVYSKIRLHIRAHAQWVMMDNGGAA